MSDEEPDQPRTSAANGRGHDGPPEEPLSPVAQRIREHIADFERELGSLKDKRATVIQEHEQKLAAIDGDIHMVEGAIAGLTGKPAPALKTFKPKRKAQPRRVGRVTGAGTATGFGVSLEACLVASRALKAMIAEKVAKGEPETFTQKEFYRHPSLDWDQGKGSAAIRYMRHIGFLRKAGRSNDTGVELWAIMDADAIEKEVRKAEAATEKYEQQVLAEQSGAPTPERVVECLREVGGEVTGESELARLTGIPKASMNDIVKSLEDNQTISVERQGPGKPKIIRLSTEKEAAKT